MSDGGYPGSHKTHEESMMSTQEYEAMLRERLAYPFQLVTLPPPGFEVYEDHEPLKYEQVLISDKPRGTRYHGHSAKRKSTLARRVARTPRPW